MVLALRFVSTFGGLLNERVNSVHYNTLKYIDVPVDHSEGILVRGIDVFLVFGDSNLDFIILCLSDDSEIRLDGIVTLCSPGDVAGKTRLSAIFLHYFQRQRHILNIRELKEL